MNCRRFWLAIFFICIIFTASILGCGGKGTSGQPDNGDPGNNNQPVDPGGGDEEGDLVDWDSLWTTSRQFQGSESFKLEWWQKEGGVESSGWLKVVLSEDDGEYTLEYEGILGDYEFSQVEVFNPESHQIVISIGQWLNQYLSHYQYSNLWTYSVVPILENFTGFYLERIGDVDGVDGYVMEVVGYDTYAGQEGVTLTMMREGRLLYEVCISPDVPLNLYSYTYDTYNGNEYRTKLVEYKD